MPGTRASQYGQRPAELVDVQIIFNGLPGMWLTVDKNAVTRHWAQHADDDFYNAINQVVTAWDLINDDESAYALTEDNWLALQLTLADEGELIKQIVKACIPSSEEGNVSVNTSSTPTGDSSSMPESAPNGHQPSSSPQPSAVELKT
jgi:hypothetical protein